MDTQANDKELIKEIERLEAQVSELLEANKSLREENNELSKKVQRHLYSGLGD
ncbi:hypothetical protein [Microcystis aeruginosa]|uniref:Uncharacterized protein n=1 Tax=Microcystis aeruginosa NIES-3787 TaxID=2517782 RepID=A0A6H9GBW8_MICAE|nr:hypothetical protein [Microcystis aeruginosa]GCL48257.1 hypothetical protein NIES3787_39730 [Microcystis aeruginosa NIES-3787]